MAVESTTRISELVLSSPGNTGEPRREGAAHIRLLKTVLKTTFPGISVPVNLTSTELNRLKEPISLIESLTITGSGRRVDLRQSADVRAEFRQAAGGNVLYLQNRFGAGASFIDFDPIPSNETSDSRVRFFREVKTAGGCGVVFHKGNGTNEVAAMLNLNSDRDGLHCVGAFNFEATPRTQGTPTAPQHLMTKEVTEATIDTKIAAAAQPLTAGAVGTYIFAGRENATVDVFFGEVVFGSVLVPAGMYANEDLSGEASGSRNGILMEGSALSGNWRCMGYSRRTNDLSGISRSATLWLRVS